MTTRPRTGRHTYARAFGLPRFVDSDIEATLRAMGGDPGQWRPHLKTAKMPLVIERLIARGVSRFKVSTTRELLVACEAGAEDVLVAYPMVGANARRVLQIAATYPVTAVSVLGKRHMNTGDRAGARGSGALP